VILGPVGINFGAGMTGGLAWVFDAAQTMVSRRATTRSFWSPQSFAETTARAAG
jgi:glutamate synthase (ferredoxin)